MPKRDPELEKLRRRFEKGALYRFEYERSINLWSVNGGARKFAQRLQNNQVVLFLDAQRSSSKDCGFRVFLIRGEDIGFINLKSYEVDSCFKLLDPENHI